MTKEERESYAGIVDELWVMVARLKHLSDAGYGDMEGADMPEFAISEELWCLEPSALKLEESIHRLERLLQ
jgi:hypothetical protein